MSRNHGYAMVRAGTLPVVKFGKRLLVPKKAVERLLEDVGPSTPADGKVKTG
ncbi:helix-turn-helix domain-containing protein [Chloroflexota bacterium]